MGPTIDVDPQDSMRNLVVTVHCRYVRYWRFRVRQWLALQLFRMGTWVAGCCYEIQIDHKGDIDTEEG